MLKKEIKTYKLSYTKHHFNIITYTNPGQKTTPKAFHSEMQNDHWAIARIKKWYREISMEKKLAAEMVEEN